VPTIPYTITTKSTKCYTWCGHEWIIQCIYVINIIYVRRLSFNARHDALYFKDLMASKLGKELKSWRIIFSHTAPQRYQTTSPSFWIFEACASGSRNPITFLELCEPSHTQSSSRNNDETVPPKYIEISAVNISQIARDSGNRKSGVGIVSYLTHSCLQSNIRNV